MFAHLCRYFLFKSKAKLRRKGNTGEKSECTEWTQVRTGVRFLKCAFDNYIKKSKRVIVNMLQSLRLESLRKEIVLTYLTVKGKK